MLGQQVAGGVEHVLGVGPRGVHAAPHPVTLEVVAVGPRLRAVLQHLNHPLQGIVVVLVAVPSDGAVGVEVPSQAPGEAALDRARGVLDIGQPVRRAPGDLVVGRRDPAPTLLPSRALHVEIDFTRTKQNTYIASQVA